MCIYGTKPLYFIVFLHFLILCQKWRNKQVYMYHYDHSWFMYDLISFDCIMQLKKLCYIATNVCSRKSAAIFGDLPDWW